MKNKKQLTEKWLKKAKSDLDVAELILDSPNIIFIIADDMGYGDVEAFNPGSRIPTPNLNQLAKEGKTFTDAHSSSAVCTPSRYSVMTGRYCWRSWLKQWVIHGFGAPVIEPERETVASLLKDNGYTTAAFGKWHLGFNWKTEEGELVAEKYDKIGQVNGFDVDYSQTLTGGPVDNGFDYFFGISASLDMPPYCFIENSQIVGNPDREKEHYYNQQRQGLQVSDWEDEKVDITFAEKAVEYIENQSKNNSEQPFFLYLPTACPHRPCDIRPDFVKGKSDAGDRGDMVVLFDWIVGQIMEVLDQQGISENTLLIVSSDNGARATCANGKNYGHKSNGDWRGQKADIWEGGHREPFIARWPKKIEEGTTSSATICLSDLMATCAGIIGKELPEKVGEDSYNFLPTLIRDTSKSGENKQTGKKSQMGNNIEIQDKESHDKSEGIVREAKINSNSKELLSKKENYNDEPIRESIIHHSGAGHFSIRKDKWKLICKLGSGGFTDPQYRESKPGEPEGQLYNLAKDPGETNNVWEQYPEVVDELTNLLKKDKKEGKSRG